MEVGCLVDCYYKSCYNLTSSGWTFLVNTLESYIHTGHTSAVVGNKIWLIGSNQPDQPGVTTEMVPVDGTYSSPYIDLNPGRGWGHCSIQVSANTVIIIGGSHSRKLVERYSGLGP